MGVMSRVGLRPFVLRTALVWKSCVVAICVHRGSKLKLFLVYEGALLDEEEWSLGSYGMTDGSIIQM